MLNLNLNRHTALLLVLALTVVDRRGASGAGELHCVDDVDVDVDIDSSNFSTDEVTKSLIAWIRTSGGFVDERLTVRRVDPSNPSSIVGIFADGGSFEKGETLFTIPPSLVYNGEVNMVKGNEDMSWEDEEGDCGTTYEIHDAMLRAEAERGTTTSTTTTTTTNRTAPTSTPYGRYLANQPRRYLPGYWSEPGRNLLNRMIGENKSGLHLPIQWGAEEDAAQTDWIEFCDGATNDELEIHAAMLVTARGDGHLMVPLYDMINHRNGAWYNAEHTTIVGDYEHGFGLRTNKKVERGDELYSSYNMCNACGGRAATWGTPEMFVEYGFVEHYPQRYFFNTQRLKFALDEREGTKDNDPSVSLEVKWYVPPSQEGLDFLERELRRLRKFEFDDDDVPETERNMVQSYHEALVVAFAAALDQAPAGPLSDAVWNMGEDWYEYGEHEGSEAEGAFERFY